MPLESIAYSRCIAENQLSLHLAAGSEIMGWDLTALGLPAAGQPFALDSFGQRIEMPGVWLERARIFADDPRLLNSPLGLAGHACLGMLYFASGSPLNRTRRVRALNMASKVVARHPLANLTCQTAPTKRQVLLSGKCPRWLARRSAGKANTPITLGDRRTPGVFLMTRFSTRQGPLLSPDRPTRGLASALHFAATTAVALIAAVATVASAQVATGTTGIDASGNTAVETAACNSGMTQQARETCLREARNAAAEKRAGKLDSNGAPGANAAQRCDVFQGEEKIACQARVVGVGETKGSVAGGGVIREVETVVVPADGSPVRVTPQTGNANIVVIPGTPK